MWLAVEGALEQGLLYSLVALGVYVTFKILQFPDLTVDGSFPLGAAVSARLIISGWDPFAAIAVSTLAGAGAGFLTGILHTRLRISALLSGILGMTALYSVNLRVMGRPNIALLRERTCLVVLGELGLPDWLGPMLFFMLILVVVYALLSWFWKTLLGLSLRATGDNEQMVLSYGTNPDVTKLVGLSLSNALVGMAGGLVAQYQGFSDISMGVGTIVVGLASVIIGEGIFGEKTVNHAMVSVMGGAVLYRFVIAAGLRMGLPSTDLKLITAVLVVAALATPRFRSLFRVASRTS
ncbi:MAG TPA: ABC transporter permease [Clostridia bacterium]|nr:ABC transporter permease [Clostridia bacterium]